MTQSPSSLNPEQQVAVNSRKGYICQVAAPGTGKTTVIVARAKAILAEGCPIQEFLSLTFTVEAAKEMNERAGFSKSEYKIFRTFHSWALEFVQRERSFFPYPLRPSILATPYIAARTLGRIVSRLSELDFKEVASYISLMKRRGITPQQAAQEESQHESHWSYVRAYAQYEEAMRDQGLMDFDSIICESAKLLERNPQIRARWQYQYCQIDEAQDTDPVQWKIVQLISEKHGNVFAVGDENQGMYSWRGSESELISRFKLRFPNAIILPLSQNYRSTAAIVDYCKEIAPHKNETIEKFSTVNAAGVPPEFKLYSSDFQEAQAVLNSITDLSNSAILTRTNRQLRAFEDECNQRNVRYRLLGKSGFWKRNEVHDVLAWVQAICLPTNQSILRAFKAHCDSTRFLSKHDTDKGLSTITVLEQLPMPGQTLWQALPNYQGQQSDVVLSLYSILSHLRSLATTAPAAVVMKQLLQNAGFLSYYDEEEEESAVDNDPRENLLELEKIASRYQSIQEFLEYTKRVARAQRVRTGYVTLSTIHQAKGKEWKSVFVAGVNDGVLPHAKGDPEEEKRIFFVACSRAAERLVVSANGVPSEFIKSRIPKETKLDLWDGFMLSSEHA
jgi:DNA helicase-2/ATP-dependent DNA helicase PcrA